MLPVTLVVLFTLVLSHWFLEPLVPFATSALNLSWIGWGVLVVLIWCFAGEGGKGPSE
jgi:hypothetical protein